MEEPPEESGDDPASTAPEQAGQAEERATDVRPAPEMAPTRSEAQDTSDVSASLPPSEAATVATEDPSLGRDSTSQRMEGGSAMADADAASRQGAQERASSLDKSRAAAPVPGQQNDSEQERRELRQWQHRQETNPYRDLGSAAEAWRDRLRVREALAEAREEQPLPMDAEADPGADAFEFTHSGEQYDAQTLASAMQDQEQPLPAPPTDPDVDKADHLREEPVSAPVPRLSFWLASFKDKPEGPASLFPLHPGRNGPRHDRRGRRSAADGARGKR
jgi:hypothetical protein